MDIQQLRDELTKRGIAFAANAGIANLQAKYDEAIAKEAEDAKLAVEAASADAEIEARAALVPDAQTSEPPGKAGKARAAALAAASAIAPADPADGAIPELEIVTKIQAGLTRDQAIEVITHQRAHDKALAAQA